jgi:acid phosphatase
LLHFPSPLTYFHFTFPANIAALAKKGILLTNYFGVTHPSEPNYISAVGGEYFGMNSDNLFSVPANVSTVVDLLESKGITWSEYMEDMPSSGFQGVQFLNAAGAADYVRKHKSVKNCMTYATRSFNAMSLAR